MENLEKIRELLKNGLFFSHHVKEEMLSENISLEQIRKVILEGKLQFDSSNQNDKSHAWNKKPHISIIHLGLNLTVIVCESLERGILVISAYHGSEMDAKGYSDKKVYLGK
jgi:hypothetical protein